jgi:lipid II:glycine glycyltransferase (peptidoglycan interpeptide bridge formation enzyme)
VTQRIHEATPDELEGWDARAVEAPGGHVYQSRTWGEYRARHGWRTRFLVFDDDFRLLSAERPWPLVGGAGAYLARGPVAAGEPPERTADRLRAAADWLAGEGVDVVSSDAEIPASSGYPAMLRSRGFHPIEEVQPSRHRMSLALAGDDDGVFRGFSKSLRQTIRTAEHKGIRIVRYDARGADDARFEHPAASGGGLTAGKLEPVFGGFQELFARTAVRRGFPVAPRAQLIDASSHAVAAGLAFLLEARGEGDELVAASLFYRHGERISYGLSADRADLRNRYPGVVQLLLWRAIQVAVSERRPEFDLAGVDVLGARGQPKPGDEMYGLYVMKERFGGTWLELSGNHEWVARPWRYAAGRVTSRLARLR